jgi:hypothetical protein
LKLTQRALGLLCGGVLAATAYAAEPAIDADLLEYLGTVDSNDAGWQDYLEQTDIDKVAKPPKAPADAPPNVEAAPAVPPKVKQS